MFKMSVVILINQPIVIDLYLMHSNAKLLCTIPLPNKLHKLVLFMACMTKMMYINKYIPGITKLCIIKK